MTIGIVLAPRSARYSRAQFQQHYESYHAPLFLSFTSPFIGRYTRNHIVRAAGADPGFDTLSEFGHYPAKRTELMAALRAPEARVLEEDVQTFLAERGNSFEVDQMLISGPPRGYEAGPVRKHAILLKAADGTPPRDIDPLARGFATAIAQQIGGRARRVELTLWKREPAPPLDAMVMVWPAEGATLPELSPSSGGLSVAYLLELDAYCTAWRE